MRPCSRKGRLGQKTYMAVGNGAAAAGATPYEATNCAEAFLSFIS